jgi:uncharacterized protein YqcC (DUF446 family)
MHDIPRRIADLLLEIEASLRVGGKWEQNQPPAVALSSTHPFCVDTLDLEQWLQWIFLPRMKQILEQQQPLPLKSGIHAYAEGVLSGKDIHAGQLLKLIRRFDELIELQSSQQRH